MNISELFIVVCWAVFLIVWIVSSLSAKRTIRGGWLHGIWLRLAIAAVVVVVARLDAGAAPHAGAYPALLVASSSNPLMAWFGVALCASGVAFAIWARFYLGRNWGMPMTIKENPELVTTGPYAYVRHPIYSGMILAILGSVFANSLLWLIVLIGAGAYFIYSARREEGLMMQQFRETYPAYMRHTKMLIPFVL